MGTGQGQDQEWPTSLTLIKKKPWGAPPKEQGNGCGSAGLMVGLGDLKGLFPPKLFHDLPCC